jgi:hypothetical protein
MKNILILTEAFPPVLNSSSKLIDELCLGLVSQKIAVTVLTESNSLMSKEIDYKDGIKLKLIPNILSKKKGFLIRGLREILLPIIFSYYGRKIIKEKKIEGIFIYSPPLTLGLCKLFFKNVPSILNVQDIFPQHAKDLKIISSKFVYNFFKFIQKIAYVKNDFVVCQSHECELYLKAIYPKLNKKISHILNWQSFDKDKFGIGNQSVLKRSIVYCGNIGPAQDIISFISHPSFKSMHYKLNIYGEGSEKENLISYLNEFPNNDISISNAVHQAELGRIFAGQSFGLVTLSKSSSTPIFPGKILTYLEYGLPILVFAPKESKLDSLIEREKFGLYIEANSLLDENISKQMDAFIIKNREVNSSIERYLKEKSSPNVAAKKIIHLLKNCSG